MPGIFPAVTLGKYVLIDGGAVWNSDIESAIHICLDRVDNDQSRVVIDVINCQDSDNKNSQYDKTTYQDTYKTSQKTYQNYMRKNEIF